MESPTIITSPNGEQISMRQADSIREQLSSALRIVDGLANMPTNPTRTIERHVRTILGSRRNRDRFFDSDLFADPAWDILLELYAAELSQQRLSVSSVCVGASVPATTALRWIGVLEKRGLVQRRADRFDGRRIFLMLTGRGVEAMNGFFRSVPNYLQPI